jgi:hypothetical protein
VASPCSCREQRRPAPHSSAPLSWRAQVQTAVRYCASPGAAMCAGSQRVRMRTGRPTGLLAACGDQRGEQGDRLGRSPERLATGAAKWVRRLELAGRGVLDSPRHGGPSLPARGAQGNKSSAVLRGTHCHLHVGPVPHVSESSPSAVLQRRLIRRAGAGTSGPWGSP